MLHPRTGGTHRLTQRVQSCNPQAGIFRRLSGLPVAGSNCGQVAFGKDYAGSQPQHSSSTQKNDHIAPRPGAAREDIGRLMVMQWAEKNELLDWRPERRQIIEQEKDKQDKKNQ